MRIFVTGANGQLAKSIKEIYGTSEDVHYASKESLDITNKRDVLKQIGAFKPDIVFHFASMTRGDECAKNPEEAKRINVGGTENIVAACEKYDCVLVFISTNEVFSGRKKAPYIESDRPRPRTVVGKTKWEAEKVIKNNLRKYYIIRTSWLYSKWSANFLHAVIKKALKDGEITLVRDEIGSPTYSLDLAKAIQKLIQTKKFGVYHLANKGEVSRLEFAKKAFEFYNLKNIKIISVSLDDFERISKPPLYSVLASTKEENVKIKMSEWESALERFLGENDLMKM